MSSFPKISMAASMMPFAPSALETSPATATALPPAALMEETTVEAILHALADPVRVALYAEIVASACPRSCSSLMGISEKAVPKSTLSQHFNVLREAGLIHSERRGVEMQNSSRCAEIERRFPGLLPAILAAHAAQQKTALRPSHAGRRKPAARST